MRIVKTRRPRSRASLLSCVAALAIVAPACKDDPPSQPGAEDPDGSAAGSGGGSSAGGSSAGGAGGTAGAGGTNGGGTGSGTNGGGTGGGGSPDAAAGGTAGTGGLTSSGGSGPDAGTAGAGGTTNGTGGASGSGADGGADAATGAGGSGAGGSGAGGSGAGGSGAGGSGAGGSGAGGSGADAGTDSGTAPCTPGALRCANDARETCDAGGQWGSTPCAQGEHCNGAGVCGACVAGTRDCNGNVPRTCDDTGQWVSGTTCPTDVVCSAGYCGGPSCDALPETCGGTHHCCESALVPGGAYLRSYDAVKYTNPGYPATVSGFRLDKFEVTVGRFRQYLNAMKGGWVPPPGSGKHSHLNGGAGLNGGTEAGWDPAWNTNFDTRDYIIQSRLTCSGSLAYTTWTASPGANEDRPMNCASWYEAYAFCIWDGGFLPTEAEWNYAAAAGSEQRFYPWSNPPTSQTIDDTVADYCGGNCTLPLNVGSLPGGNGKWGQSDLGGGVFEWTLDVSYNPYNTVDCVDCAEFVEPQPQWQRITRGGSFRKDSTALRTAERYNALPIDAGRSVQWGFRCARTP